MRLCLASDRGGEVILLVEDQLIIQRIELNMINALGRSADVACNGAQALAMAEQKSYQLIFMDLVLPDTTGIEITQQLRAMGVTTPIVAITGNDDEQTRHECQQAGMNGFLAKPLNPQTLQKVIERYT